MPTRTLPRNPNLRNLRNQAKTLLDAYRTGDQEAIDDFADFHSQNITAEEAKLTDAQLVLARSYRFPSWPRLQLAAQLVKAIHDGDKGDVQKLILAHPNLLNENTGSTDFWGPPLVWATLPRDRIDILRCLIDLGAGPDQLDKAFRRATSSGNFEAAEFLHSVDSTKAIRLSPLDACEGPNAKQLKFILTKGGDPNFVNPDDGQTPLGMLLGTYGINADLQTCVRLLIEAGVHHTDGPHFDILSGQIDKLKDRLKQNPSLVHEHFSYPEGRLGHAGGAYFGAPLNGTSLLHLCANYNFVEEAKVLIDAGADVNARAQESVFGCNHTPIYHAVTSNANFCHPMAELLIAHGADLDIRATIQLPHHKGADRVLNDVTPLGYAYEFPKPPRNLISEDRTLPHSEVHRHEPHPRIVDLLTSHGAKI